ncbi:MAG: hypothetical protein KatS3mg019_2482 [Fimbriimonadales bacterium]|nr:MAG: hypothetical protein KatS3mg019_2482 [Fimbriimonadales bacterium]
MSERDAMLFLQDILECIEKIEQYVHRLTYEQFLQDPKTQDAVLRNLEIIGEAARRVPAYIQAQHSEVPWGQIIALRSGRVPSGACTHRLPHKVHLNPMLGGVDR